MVTTAGGTEGGGGNCSLPVSRFLVSECEAKRMPWGNDIAKWSTGG